MSFLADCSAGSAQWGKWIKMFEKFVFNSENCWYGFHIIFFSKFNFLNSFDLIVSVCSAEQVSISGLTRPMAYTRVFVFAKAYEWKILEPMQFLRSTLMLFTENLGNQWVFKMMHFSLLFKACFVLFNQKKRSVSFCPTFVEFMKSKWE